MYCNMIGDLFTVLLLVSDAQIERPPRKDLSQIGSGQEATRAAASVSVHEGLIYEIVKE